ncbi:MAG: hypothetical protein HZB57_01975 [Gammaproteobacteria bacterium]|nr:hypothetical protein [Gammaproteobacteria bacterium]
MNDKPEERLIWEGQTTLTALYGLVQGRVSFELQLAPDYHFALFRHLYPDANAAEPELIDVSGGADLLDKVAEIQGLNELAELAAPIAAAGGRVHIQSPGPGILVCFPPQS